MDFLLFSSSRSCNHQGFALLAALTPTREKLAKLKGEGLNDMDEFMDSFGQGQLATDDVKCDLCKHLMFDLDASASKLRTEGMPEVCAHARSRIIEYNAARAAARGACI